MRALRLTRWKQDAELYDVAEPVPGPGEVLDGAMEAYSEMCAGALEGRAVIVPNKS